MDWRLNTQHLEQYESVFRTRGFRKASRELSVSHNTIEKISSVLKHKLENPCLHQREAHCSSQHLANKSANVS